MASKTKVIQIGYQEVEIPTDWEWDSLGNIFNFKGGMSLSRSYENEKGQVFHLHYGDIHKYDTTYFDLNENGVNLPNVLINEGDIKKDAILKTGDVVFADASEDYEGLGKSVVIFNETKKILISSLHTIIGREKGKLLDNQFKRWIFSHKVIREEFMKYATGISVYGINQSNIKKLKVIIPPLPEQHKIAAILSSVDTAIQATNTLIEKTQRLKQGLMQQLLTKGIPGRHSEFKVTKLGLIPKDWNILPIGKMGKVVTGKTPSTSNETYFNGDIPFITPFDMTNAKYIDNVERTVSEEGLNQSVELPPESIAVTCIGSTIGKMGMTNVRSSSNQQINTFIPNSNYNNDYLFYAMKYWLPKQLPRYETTTAVPIVNKSNFEKIPIIVMDKIEQLKIAAIFSSVDNAIQATKKVIYKTQRLKKGLMQQLLTGEIRVKIDE